ncbi:MAG: hypothetical protein PUG74_06655 [Prevotellaceae bacterium]|nr:hypothetical protein [Prevotellaceae bacterium]
MENRNRSKRNGIYEAAVTLINNKTKAVVKIIAKLVRKAKEVCVGILSKRVPYPAPCHRVFCHHHPLPPCFFSRFSFGLLNVLNTICAATYAYAWLVCVVLLCGCKSTKTVEHNETMTSDVSMLHTIDRGTTDRYNRGISAILDDLALRNVSIRITDYQENGQGVATVARVTEIVSDSVGAAKAQVRHREGAERSDSVAAIVTSSASIAAESAQKTEEQPKKVSGWRAASTTCIIVVIALFAAFCLFAWRSKGNFWTKIIKWLLF